MKYIVRGCPNLASSVYADGTETKDECSLSTADKGKAFCKDCNDCTFKEVINMCKYQLRKMNHHPFILGAKDFARGILETLDVEEVNE